MIAAPRTVAVTAAAPGAPAMPADASIEPGGGIASVDLGAADAPAAPRVLGAVVDAQTRCAHYRGERDVIAMRFACCGDYYPCFECHEQAADHPVERWRAADLDRAAVLCGVCRSELSIREYLTAGDTANSAIGDATTGDAAADGATEDTAGGGAIGNTNTNTNTNTNGAATHNAANDVAADVAATHDPACPRCAASFNPGCRLHHDLYFDFPPPAPS